MCPAPGVPCRPYCGDSMLVGGEECDDRNRVSGDGCSRSCRVERPVDAVCGDRVVAVPEDCDDGALANDGHYGGCNADCTYAAYCGDGVVNGDEPCDAWPNATEYGSADGCTEACQPAGYCGDGSIDALHGESCDNGPEHGGPCNNCHLYVGP